MAAPNRFVWTAEDLPKVRFFQSLEEMRAYDALHREDDNEDPDPEQATVSEP